MRKRISQKSQSISHGLKTAGLCTILMIIGILLAQAAYAQPGEGIKAGNWKVHPFAGTKETYDSNIFQEPTSEKHDWITTFLAGFDLEGLFAGDAVRGGYSAEYNLFANYSKESALNQYADAMIKHIFKNDILLTVDDDFQHSFSRPDTETTQRVSWNRNNLGAKLSADYNRFGWSAEYRDVMYNYQTDGWEFENRWDNIVNLALSYRVYTKTYIFTEFNYGNIDYVKKYNSDGNYFQSLVGIRGKITPKLTGTMKVGWQYRNYTRDTMNNYNSPVTMAGLIEQFTSRDTLAIDWIRSPYESLYTGSNYFVDNSIKLNYKHKFTDKVAGNLGGLYRLSQYPSDTLESGTWKKRLDNTWSVGAGIEYDMQKWLVWKAGYDFSQRQSNFGNFDYNDNLASVSVKAMY